MCRVRPILDEQQERVPGITAQIISGLVDSLETNARLVGIIIDRGSSENPLPSYRKILAAPLGENMGVPGLKEAFREA